MEGIYEKLLNEKKKGQSSVLVTVVDKSGNGPTEIGKKMLVTSDEIIGTVGGGALENYAINKSKDLLIEGKNVLEHYLLEEGEKFEKVKTLPMSCGGKVSLLYEYIGYKALVYIFGAGHVSQALTNILKTLNLHITVIDDRTDLCVKYQGANKVVNKPFIDFIETNGIANNSFVIVATPSHKHDFNILDKIISMKLNLRYYGMLCSKKKLRQYLDRLDNIFSEDIDLTNFYSPIGLDIGGASPEEIAVSITSEILSVVYNKKHHNHMRDRVL